MERHRQRRAQGIPTVTVLTGDRRVGAWLWSSMLALQGQSWFVAQGSEDFFAQWLRDVNVASALRASILSLMATESRTSLSELAGRLQGRSTWQLEQLAEQTSATHDLTLPMVRGALGLAVDPAVLRSTPHAMRQVERLLGRVPPLLVEPESTSIDSLCQAAMAVVDFARVLPRTDVGLLVGDIAIDSLRTRVPDRAGVMLKEGLVVPRARSAHAPSSHPGVIVEYDADAFARSRAELKLFETLNGRTRTTGVFKLNQRIEHGASEMPLEIDLLCESLKLAVEVDGYHHFRDAYGYRRDRRKDVLLQHLGYFVVRVLASDVENELEHVLEIIDAAVERRTRRALDRS